MLQRYIQVVSGEGMGTETFQAEGQVCEQSCKSMKQCSVFRELHQNQFYM